MTLDGSGRDNYDQFQRYDVFLSCVACGILVVVITPLSVDGNTPRYNWTGICGASNRISFRTYNEVGENMMPLKVCVTCKVEKYASEFHRHSASPDGLQYDCKLCRSGRRKRYRLSHLSREQRQRKQWRRDHPVDYRTLWLKSGWRRAGIDCTIEKWNQLYVSQQGRCAICDEVSLDRKLVLDHNHKTGKVRGLLCNICNLQRVAVIENNISLIPKILEYLNAGTDAISV